MMYVKPDMKRRGWLFLLIMLSFILSSCGNKQKVVYMEKEELYEPNPSAEVTEIPEPTPTLSEPEPSEQPAMPSEPEPMPSEQPAMPSEPEPEPSEQPAMPSEPEPVPSEQPAMPSEPKPAPSDPAPVEDELTPVPDMPTQAPASNEDQEEKKEDGFLSFADSGRTNYPISWTDQKLGEAVAKQFGKSRNEVMYSDLFEAKELDLNNSNIDSVADLRVCYNLKVLNINSNNVNDLTPLASLSNLTYFYGRNNSYSDLTPLASLPSLKSVDVSNTPSIGTLLSLGTNKNIVRYTLYNMNLDNTDLSALISVFADNGAEIQKFDISGNPRVTDYSPIARLTGLEEFYAEYNFIDDWALRDLASYLADLPKLKELTLQMNNITDPEPITMLTHLTYLNIANNPVRDISVLAERMPSLEAIAMTGTNADTGPAENAGIGISDTISYQS